ncbi:ABC-type phosphate transport system permease subunit [Saccharococcus thermophilus]|uniref:ABC-type phosphate transport system permease subunit n=1 Tax=Saccharococcus thermophilus TaxID=29396 RepID=A0A846MAX3_9BACL|nr:ABC-type phosphate transport system permease subunit [Saccharococcus thermophilus]
MKMEIKRVVTMIHLKFIITLAGYIDTYKKESVPKVTVFGTLSFICKDAWKTRTTKWNGLAAFLPLGRYTFLRC